MYAEPSSEQAKVDPTFEAENWNVADVDATLPLGPQSSSSPALPDSSDQSGIPRVVDEEIRGERLRDRAQETSLWF